MVRPGLAKAFVFPVVWYPWEGRNESEISKGKGSSQNTWSETVYAKHRLRQPALKNIWQKEYDEFFRFLMFPFFFYFLFRGQAEFKVKNELP